MKMFFLVGVICVAVLALIFFFYAKRMREEREIEQHTITAEALHELLLSHADVLLFDVRLSLDLLAHTEMISGAKRIAPEDIIQDPSLIPRDKDVVVYCTSPDQESSRGIIRHALGLGFLRMRLLKGGLDAWKAKGYSVEPYKEPFHLHDPDLAEFKN